MKNIKKLLTALLLLCVIFANAQSVVKVGELYYKIDDTTRTAEVVGCVIVGENLLHNSSFETWEGGKPTSWGMTVTNGSYTQSSEANTGSSAVLFSGNADVNKRLASKSYTLKPGTYTLAAYFKQSGETLGQFRLGYAKLTNGVVADTQNDYIYLTSAAQVPSAWEQSHVNFTLETETEVAIIIMNSKYGSGAAILVDDVILTTVDGGIVEGTESDDSENTEKPVGTYISESFAASLGSFTTQQTVGNYPWINDYSTAKATSYDGANNEATSWLISPAVDFTEETEAYAAFEYIIRYAESGKVAENHQLLISADYKDDVATATWTDLPYNAVEGSDWQTFYKANINIPAEFLGKANITFAFRYTATTKAGTWEVRNFVVAHGKTEITETPDTPETPSEYTVTGALAAFVAGEAKPAIVKGYIVGSIDDKSISDANFSGAAVLKTNLIIADNAEETDYNNCLPVLLPAGDVREALNLVDNPGNYKKYVVLTGSLEKYFSVAGLKSVTAYSIDSVTSDEPDTPAAPANAYISEAFTNGFGVFATQETVGEYPWISDATYGAEASGYADGASYDAESWLISSAIDFTNETAAYIAFDYVINKGDASAAAANHKLLITNNYTGDVATTEWTEVNYGAVNNGNWKFHNTGNIALPESMMGKDAVVIAFKYMSTTANSSTWEIKNVVVASGIGITPETPETPETPAEPETPAAASFDFTNPEALTPSVERATVETGATQGAGVEFDEITFTNSNVTVKVSQGSASNPAKFWTRTGGDVELRTYKSSTITISVSEGTMSSIVFKGGKVSTMSADCGSFSTGTWNGEAQSVTFSVTGTLNIQKITVNATAAQVTKNRILKSANAAIIESVIIPESIDVDGCEYAVTSIGDAAFLDCVNLRSVTIGSNVVNIGSSAFNNCMNLTSLVIPDGVTTIGSYAFCGCRNVETLYISNAIESIGSYAFADCNRVLEIKMGSNYAIIASENIFSSNTYINACLYVPEGRKFAYEKATPWKNFYIQEMDFTGIDNVKAGNGNVKTIYDLQGKKVETLSKGFYIIGGKKVLVK